MEKKKEVLIIIPAYNEEKTITALLEQLEKPEISELADVLVMNDASLDSTNWITKRRNHAVVTHVFNLGYEVVCSLDINMQSAKSISM